jgi:hypothetical protein
MCCQTSPTQVTLLGPVAAAASGRVLPLGGLKQRCVFALLALNVKRTVSLDRLVHEIWREEPPARATLALQAYISRLRKVLAWLPDDQGARIVTRRPGWAFIRLASRARGGVPRDRPRAHRDAAGNRRSSGARGRDPRAVDDRPADRARGRGRRVAARFSPVLRPWRGSIRRPLPPGGARRY